MRHSVDYLYSLYDVLISINVPNDKARAVVDAMERDMATTIATKSDLQLLQQATKADLELLQQATRADLRLVRQETRADLQQLRQETKADLQQLRQDTRSDLQLLRQELISAMSRFATKDELQVVRADIGELRQDVSLIRKDLELLPTSMTVRLGSMLMLGLGLLFAALKLT
ncbi:MAG: hypothetical protein ABL989_11955 [Gammaproteobacteria bacterium]